MISEGFDTEDWSNNKIQLCVTIIDNILKCIKIENIYIKL